MGGLAGGATDASIRCMSSPPIAINDRVFYVYGQSRFNRTAGNPTQYADGSGTIYAIDQFTGEVIYAEPINGPTAFIWGICASIDTSSPTSSTGATIYLPSADSLYLIDAWNGRTAARLQANCTGQGYCAPYYYKNYVYFSNFDDAQGLRTIYCVYVGSGNYGINSPTTKLSPTWTKQGRGISVVGVMDDIAVMATAVAPRNLMGLNYSTGEVLWETPIDVAMYGGSLGNGKVYRSFADGYIRAFDLQTGKELWQSSEKAGQYWGYGFALAYNKVYAGNYDGYLYCFEESTGKLLWKYYSGDCSEEPYKSLYGTWPFHQAPVVADGKVYVVTGDHTPKQVLMQGERLICLNAETGEALWDFPVAGSSEGTNCAIANGLLFSPDYYTGFLRAFGKGPTKVDIVVSDTRVNKGDYTWISGKVVDQSPAQKDTPCVSEESMESWMKYLHGGMPMPLQISGVPVKLSFVGADGSQGDITTVTTDGYTGEFSFKWTPPNETFYKIIATFEGAESYDPSSGSTYLSVGPAASPTPSVTPALTLTPTATPTTTASPSIVQTTLATGIGTEVYIAIALIVIIITASAVALLQRKRK